MVMTWMCGAARDVQRAGVQLAAVCPGAIASNIARHTPYVKPFPHCIFVL
jgi:hypothetical protein